MDWRNGLHPLKEKPRHFVNGVITEKREDLGMFLQLINNIVYLFSTFIFTYPLIPSES